MTIPSRCLLLALVALFPAALTMILYAVFISIAFFRAHRLLYPLSTYDRVVNVVKMLLCPPFAIRAADLLSLHALSRFHPVLLASLLPGPHTRPFLRSWLADLDHPLRHGFSDSPALSIASWYARAERDRCAALLNAHPDLALDRLLTPPACDGLSVSYCPRCLAQFTASSSDCPDCPGVPLRPFPPSNSQGADHA